ncbi:MAG: hypothetical protein AAF226_19150 [Verrucomicrobiota bacterium]
MDFEDFAHSPEYSPLKFWLFGVLTPLFFVCCGVEALITKDTWWIVDQNSSDFFVKISGPTALGIATCHLGIGAFCHMRWCWGMLEFYRIFITGSVLSLLAVASGIIIFFRGTLLYGM